MLYKKDLARAQLYWDAFWKKEVLDRPLVVLTAPKNNITHEQYTHKVNSVNVLKAKNEEEFHGLLESFENHIKGFEFMGEAIPYMPMDFGPDMFASFLGADIFGSDTVRTTWVNPIINNWDNFDATIRNDETSIYQRYLKFLHYAIKYSDDKFLVSVPDLHTNMDTLSALRGPQNLCFDLMDYPDKVQIAIEKARKLYIPFYEEISKILNIEKQGSIGWAPTWSRGKFAVVQCDFQCLISPAQCKKFVIPAIEEEASYLDNCVFHYDGKEALVHLDSILAIKEIDVIQWVPGDGQPRSIMWMDLLKKIQNAGKGLWIYDWTIDEIKANFRNLKPEGLVFQVSASSVGEGEELLEYLRTNM